MGRDTPQAPVARKAGILETVLDKARRNTIGKSEIGLVSGLALLADADEFAIDARRPSRDLIRALRLLANLQSTRPRTDPPPRSQHSNPLRLRKRSLRIGDRFLEVKSLGHINSRA